MIDRDDDADRSNNVVGNAMSVATGDGRTAVRPYVVPVLLNLRDAKDD